MRDICLQEVMSVISVHQRAGDVYENTGRESHTLIWTAAGEMEYRQGDSVCVAEAGSLLWIPKGAAYSWRCLRDYHSYVIRFFASGLTGGMRIIGKGDFGERIERLSVTEHRLRRLSEFYALLAETEEWQPADVRRKKQMIAPSLRYIQQNFHLPLTVRQMAEPSHISAVYFRRLFVSLYGKPPGKYLSELRVSSAKRLLLSGESVSYVAERCGWSSVYSFSASFKRSVGRSPRQFVADYHGL